MQEHELLIREYLRNPIFKLISSEADALGVDAYLIGGFVRDMLLGRPCKDIDIMAVGSGIELAQKVSEKLGKKGEVAVFANFGTAMIKYGEYDLEFVGARKESYRENSRKPSVESGTLEDDLNRRDFTINALAIKLNKAEFGKPVDRFGGLRDLEQGILRTPLNPDITYSDDPLRMMRAIRFASQLQFQIETRSLESISRNAERIRIISKERIADELNKIVLSPTPSIGFKLLFSTGLLEIIFPEMTALHGVENVEGKGHKDNFYHTLQVLDNLSKNTDNLWLRWAAIMHDIAKPPTKRFEPGHGWTFHGHEDLGAKMTPGIFKRLSLPLNEKMKYVQKLVRLHLRPIVLAKEQITDSAIRRLIFDAGEDIEDLLMLCEADITSKNEEKVVRYLSNYKKVRKRIKEVEEKDHLRNFQPPVSGQDIMEAFGITPCEEIGTIKTAIKDAILDGMIQNNREEALVFMYKKGAELGFSAIKQLS
ncbi:MAG: CCA tRNA nucleotidyltransferase [Flavobacteriales bacterium]|nr:CCA tRNA nucleotidyltransferase [Flavobacteriales bacterium]